MGNKKSQRSVDRELDSLLARSNERRQEQGRQRAAEAQMRGNWRQTALALELVLGDVEHPVVEVEDYSLVADLDDWAGKIVHLAKAWSIHPGGGVLDSMRVSEAFPGVAVGSLVFRRALKERSPSKTRRRLEEAVPRLGNHEGPTPSGLSDFEIHGPFAFGLWLYFNLLANCLHERRWRLPNPFGQVDERAGKQVVAKPKSKRGRRTPRSLESDQRLVDAWKSGRFARHAELEREYGCPAGTVKNALDRLRAREHAKQRRGSRKGKGQGA